MKIKNLILIPATALLVEACSSSQETITPKEIGSLSAPKQNVKVVKDTLKAKRDFLLPPVPFYDAWSTGRTLTQWAPVVDGPINFDLRRISGKEGFLEYAKLDSSFIRHFEGTNPYLTSKKGRSQFKNLLSQYKLFPKELAHVFTDGKILSKEELDLINNMPNGEYILAFYYKSFYYKSKNYNDKKVPKNKKESAPGILRVFKDDNNFNYEFLTKVRELAENKRDTTSEVSVIPDTSYCELDTTKAKQSFMDLSFGYDFDNMFNIDARFRLGNRLSIGPVFGVGLEDEKNLWITTNKYILDGSEAMQNYFMGVSAGIDLSNYVMLNLNSGVEFQRINVDEKIRRKTQEVLSHNSDNYLRTGFRGGVGVGYNVTEALNLEANLVYSSIEETKLHPRSNVYAGLRARFKVK